MDFGIHTMSRSHTQSRELTPYSAKSSVLSGTSLSEVMRGAHAVYNPIKHKTKRNPYIRSVYFEKEKVFFDFFWEHLSHKSPRERMQRLKYFKVAIELIEQSRQAPLSKPNPNKPEVLHRFAGLTRERFLFYVQIKETVSTGRKYFMSCFPPG